MPLRALLTGAIIAIFVATLSALLPGRLPGARAAAITQLAASMVFAVLGVTSDLAYVFADGSPYPSIQPAGMLLIAVSIVVFVVYSGIAIRLLPGIRRWQLALAVVRSPRP